MYCSRFAFQTSQKGLDSAPDLDVQDAIEDTLVGFIHVEAKDEEDASRVETKLVKNLKWAARKNESNRIVLHSFTHLSESKADPEFTKKLFDNAESRLQKADYEVSQTPFGYFLNLDLSAPGFPLARLFKDI
jgi:hypothetical protein